ncbi:MAG: DMT family transporter [Clostridia bacterium]|nr:DMT family transporter [Clostridia bacterium]
MSFVRQTIFPILAAFLWGTTFVAQSVGAEHLGCFGYNMARSFVAVIFLGMVIFGMTMWKKSKGKSLPHMQYASSQKEYNKVLLTSGFICGTCLTVAANLQQAGIAASTAGKASFITALYVVLVPIFGIVLKKKAPGNVWLAVVIAAIGLYFICIKPGEFSIEFGDFLLLLCAISYAVQILVIDHYSNKVDGIQLSCTQFFFVAVESLIISLIFENNAINDYIVALYPILYAGILSSGIAYTLQILSQKGSNPTVVTVLMSLESVFGVVSSAIVLHERMITREYLGCVLMFVAVLLAQIPVASLINKKKA